MADYRIPAGDPTEPHSAEDVLLQGFTDVLRSRSIYVPPRSQGQRGDIIPKGLYRKYMANALTRQTQAIAAEHDARDLAFNHRVQAVKESASGFAPPYSDKPSLIVSPEEQARDEWNDEYEEAISRFDL